MRHLLFAFLIAVPSIALADVVDPEPPSCPPGSTPATAHSGPYCYPSGDCTSDSMCGAGSTCNPVMQCIETRGCGGLSFPDAEPCTLEHVVGACAGDGSCAVGECRARSVCSGGETDGGCGCSAPGAPRGFAASFVLMLVALFVLRRAR